jgi:hypothetical protein
MASAFTLIDTASQGAVVNNTLKSLWGHICLCHANKQSELIELAKFTETGERKGKSTG